MKYRVTNYIDGISKCEKYTGNDAQLNRNYNWFDTYGEAKQFIIERAKTKIINLEKEIKSIKAKIPKLEKLTEKIKQ